MKKILEGFYYGILGSIFLIIISGSIIGLINFSMWLFNYQSPGICGLFVIGVIGFIIGIAVYLDILEQEGKND